MWFDADNKMSSQKNIFSLERGTRQTEEEMQRELSAFRVYWGVLNEGNSKAPVKAADYMRWKDRRFHYSTLARFFGEWAEVCKAADMNVWKTHRYDDEDIINLFLDCWRWRGQRPVITDLKRYNKEHGTMLSEGTIANRWGNWASFVKLISQLGQGQITVSNVIDAKIEKNPREAISASLRSRILRRDNYTCVDCGASPRKDSKVTLHIHHIKPVSKGGKSVIENLVTNCSACNLGKSDIILSD